MHIIQYVRSTILPSKTVQLLVKTWLRWDQDNCPGMAASLSYFALFALFPLLLVLISIISFFIGPNTEAFQTIASGVERFLPPEAHDLVKGTILTMNENSVGAGIIGFGILLFASSSVFGILRQSVNKIWRSPSRVSEAGSPFKMALFFLRNQIFAFLLVFGTALLLITSLIANIVIKTILELVAAFQETFSFIEPTDIKLDRGLEISSSFLILSLAICVLFKILPSVNVRWGDVWLGALLTALIIVGLQQLVSSSVISLGGRFLSYGVIGSVMVLMLWIFLTCQIFFFGCELTYVYAHMFGSRRNRLMEPSDRSSV